MATVTDKSFAQSLKKWRAKFSLLQKEAADILKVPLDTYRAWENEQSLPASKYPPTRSELETRIAAYKP